MQLRPVETAAQAPDVDDVADQVELVHVHAVQELEQQLGTALARAEVHIGEEDAAHVYRGGALVFHASKAAGPAWQWHCGKVTEQ